MLESNEATRIVGRQADRRSNIRRKVTALSYIQVGEANSGFVLDISEGGLSFQPFAGIEGAQGELRAPVRFQLPHSWDWIESAGKTIWTSEERIAAGIQFIDLPEPARAHIREWILTHDPETEANTTSSGRPREKSMPAVEALSDLPRALASLAPTLKALNEASPAIAPGVAGARRESLIPSMLSAGTALPQKKSPVSERQAMDGSVEVVVKLPSRWMLPLLVSLVVVVSFALGVSVGHGSLDHWLGTAAPENSPAASAQAGNGRSASGSAENSGAGAPGAQNSTGANDQSAAGSVKAVAPPSASSGEAGAPSASALGGASSWAERMLQGTAQGPISIFVEPDRSVSASATTAIASRRSIALRVAADGKIAEPPPGFHFGALLNHTDPSYPPEAIDKLIEGTVELRATIGRDGNVVDVQPLGGPEALVPASIAAVRIWQYKPTYLNGHSVETSDTLRITFRRPH